jgi:hypothetical protein
MSGETLTIEEGMNLKGKNGERQDVGDDRVCGLARRQCGQDAIW